MDVDPDIRFMALEDLRKFLQDESAALTRTTLNQSLENFFPILLNMLNDQNPDVQTQAIKSFEPMVKYLSNETFRNWSRNYLPWFNKTVPQQVMLQG